jgi:hypothetical protein
MKHHLIDKKQMQNKEETTSGASDRRNCAQRSHRRLKNVNEALELMRGLVRSPVGEFPERDEQIRAAWHSSAE